MTIHLLKLCVGANSVEDLESFIAERKRVSGKAYHWHQTRMVPKRRDDLLTGGSLYWVIRGQISARQRIDDLEPFVDESGVSRCRIILDPTVVRTFRQPRRPFQGWRYFEPDDVPGDLADASDGEAGMPAELQEALRELGVV